MFFPESSINNPKPHRMYIIIVLLFQQSIQTHNRSAQHDKVVAEVLRLLTKYFNNIYY